MTLQMQVQNLQTDDEIAVRLNGQLVAGWQRDANERLTAPVRPALLRQGSNPVSMRLVKRAATSAAPRTVTALELHAVRKIDLGYPFNRTHCKLRRRGLEKFG